MKYELLEQRILGALSFQDATTNVRIRRLLKIEAAPGVALVRNRSGYYVIFAAPGFEAYTSSFAEQPVAPDPHAIAAETVALELKVSDMKREYLPRRCTVKLPLDPATKRPANGQWLFDPIRIKLYPAPTARTVPGWAIVRATVREDGKRTRLPWSLITIRRDGKPEALATGLADHRGEAFVAVPGLPVAAADEGQGAVMTSEIPVSLEVVFDTTLQKVRDPEDLAAFTDTSDAFAPDPSILEKGIAPRFRSATKADTLASGREHRIELTVNLS